MMCGKLLGHGISRKVFACSQSPTMVVKVEDDDGPWFQNIIEWETWRHVQDSPEARWFAPCHHISPNGRVMLMARTEPCPRTRLPDRLPKFLSDMKQDNFGLLRGRVVCHDYGTNVLFTYGQTKATKKAQWT